MVGHQREAGDIARLALVGSHAEGSCALQVFDRLVTFARRQRNVGNRRIVLQVDQCLPAAMRRAHTLKWIHAQATMSLHRADGGRKPIPARRAAVAPAAAPSAIACEDVIYPYFAAPAATIGNA